MTFGGTKRSWLPTWDKATVILELRSVDTGFGGRQVLHDISFALAPGEILALIGPNGAGKSTVLKAIFGLVRVWAGDVVFAGQILGDSKPAQRLRLGMALAPQGEKVFRGMTVRENLEVGSLVLDRRTRSHRVSTTLAHFPVLRERLSDDAGKLSGGQQQMLVLARALLNQPKLLLLDEPSAGLSPGVAEETFSHIAQICSREKITAVIVEHRIPSVMRVASQICALKLGRVAFLEKTEQVQANRQLLTDLFL